MRRLLRATAGAAGAVAVAGVALAQPTASGGRPTGYRLFGLVEDEIVAVRPYRPFGLDPQRGFEMDTRPRQNILGDCRSQRITFLRRHYPGVGFNAGPDALDKLAVANRFQRAGWVQSRAPRDCGNPDQGSWTEAKDDDTFYRAANVLSGIAPEAAAPGAGGAYTFTLTCTEYGKRCAEPATRLKEAFALGVEQVSYDGATLVASHLPYGGRQWIMRVEFGPYFRLSSINLDFPVPPLS